MSLRETTLSVDVVETQVAIIGAGPAGLVLSHLLTSLGIESVVLEVRDRDYVEHRVRAGVLESPSVELLRSLGLADRLERDGLAHRGIELAFNGRRHRLDFVDLVGTSITVYGQQEVVKDLIAARLAAGDPIVFEALDVTLEGLAAPNDLDGDRPVVRYRHGGREHELRCQVIAGCDGFHGISRDHVAGLATATRDYPFAWLGILAEAAPTIDELIYSNHERGFALYSMRSPTITRMYLQVAADEQLDTWSDDRIWSEFDERLPTGDDFAFNTGPIIERGITAMRSVVATPMRHGRLLLAGDAAHIVPPTGAKGMNLAIADVAVMAQVLDAALNKGDSAALERYTETCLTRVWRAQHFSWWMTSMLHRFGDDPFQRELQLSELALVTTSTAAATNLAQNYVGLPFGTLR
ncbi:MAG: 4-hydroxybenzoate 3-monooxygenase [Ilumatobacteraceae bacterium]